MPLNTVIFDMDGLLIDSEPFWQEAGIEILQHFGVTLTLEQYHRTTGLRSKEWIEYWFNHFRIDNQFAKETEDGIIEKAIQKIKLHGDKMPGVDYILSFFRAKGYKIGLATSSPERLIEVVVDKLGIRDMFDAWSSAELLPFSKPHPQVFLDCAEKLKSNPLECICFEDSFNGLIAVKAARMTCVVVPASPFYMEEKWGAADLKLPSLNGFRESHLSALDR